MRLFIRYLKSRRVFIILICTFSVIFFTSFVLYRLPMKAVLYPALLCLLSGGVIMAADYREGVKKHKYLEDMKKLTHELIDHFPECETIAERDYTDIVKSLKNQHIQLVNKMNRQYKDMIDYYTVWAHQIKTPISSMRLSLERVDSSAYRSLSGDLFRIEQYVEMVLAFLRIGSSSTDYMFKKYELDVIIKQCVKKFSSEFIGRKIRLELSPSDMQIITDEKWLVFVIEQILSNALKYTHSGGTVKIYPAKPNALCIEDNGIGIEPADLPRIFEKGFTGYNGRQDKRASGIGLYLCRKICENLHLDISVRSVPEKGTTVMLRFDQKNTVLE